MRHILVTLDKSGAVTGVSSPIRFEEFAGDPPKIDHKGLRWLPCAASQPPAFDDATETVEATLYQIQGSTVVEVRAKRALTTAELDARRERRLDIFDKLQFEIDFDQESRLRLLEGKQTVTRAQYRAALKARL